MPNFEFSVFTVSFSALSYSPSISYLLILSVAKFPRWKDNNKPVILSNAQAIASNLYYVIILLQSNLSSYEMCNLNAYLSEEENGKSKISSSAKF